MIVMKIIRYENKYKNQMIALILYLQNFDNCVDLSLEEQPDMNDVQHYYQKNGGEFWLAIDDDDNVAGTIGLMKKDMDIGILKKFFVQPDYRGKQHGVSSQLYDKLVTYAKKNRIQQLLLDTPSRCLRAHNFYEKHGFERIVHDELPISYDYPDRDSYLYLKKI